jgi:alkanesulfonate monooxygenase SsuD/methylene tetrahydromethanopterin reductase-like flavin-dependent oxidoreductase (luciferase family)
MSALAVGTERLRLGTLVSPVTFRHPTVLAKVAATVDRISNGRVEIGMGAGWWEEEHRTHGFGFPPTGERFELLEEQLEIVHGLLSEETFSFESPHYAMEDCRFLPKAVQRPHPPIIVGGDGKPRLARLVARWADEFNTVGGTPDEVRERYSRVRDAVHDAGRDQDGVTTSLMTWLYVGETEADARARYARAQELDPDLLKQTYEETTRECIVGSPEQAAERLNEYAAAGVQRVMLNHSFFDDLDTLELLAAQVFPKVTG